MVLKFIRGKNCIVCQLGSVTGPVIQVSGRLEFEDGLRSSGPQLRALHVNLTSALRSGSSEESDG